LQGDWSSDCALPIWQRPQSLLGDLFTAFETVAVIPSLEPRQGVVDLGEGLGLHLDERKLDVFLNVGFRALDRVEHLGELTAESRSEERRVGKECESW